MHDSKIISPPEEKKIIRSTQTKKEKKELIILRGTTTSSFSKRKELVVLRGRTSSQINQAPKAKNPYPARVFLKVKGQGQDIPVFFRIKDLIKSKFHDFIDPNYIGTYEMEINQCPFCQRALETEYNRKWCWNKKCLGEFRLFEKSGGWIRPKIPTNSQIEVKGYFDHPKNGSARKSFTAYSYQVLTCPFSQKKPYHCPIDCQCLKGKELRERVIREHNQPKFFCFKPQLSDLIAKEQELEKVKHYD